MDDPNFKWRVLSDVSDGIASGFKIACIVSIVGTIGMAIWTIIKFSS